MLWTGFSAVKGTLKSSPHHSSKHQSALSFLPGPTHIHTKRSIGRAALVKQLRYGCTVCAGVSASSEVASVCQSLWPMDFQRNPWSRSEEMPKSSLLRDAPSQEMSSRYSAWHKGPLYKELD